MTLSSQFYETYYLATIICFGMSLISLVTLRFTLDRSVRNYLLAHKGQTDSFNHFFGLIRTSTFAHACTSNWGKKSWAIKQNYEGINIKAIASKPEVLLTYTFVFSAYSLLALLLIFFITDVSGIIQWPK